MQEPGSQADLIELFAHSGWMAKAVLASLLLLSLASWVVIVSKLIKLRQAERHSARFIELFHKSKRFSEISAQCGKLYESPLVGLFQAGYAELDAQIKSQKPATETIAGYKVKSLESIQRALARAAGVETNNLSRQLILLATTASAAPFIGLFGTVWGIMNSFREIGLTGSTSIVTVAPGISEALINTAAGLAAAIPALIAYNYFAQRVRRLRSEMEDFGLEFLTLTERNFT